MSTLIDPVTPACALDVTAIPSESVVHRSVAAGALSIMNVAVRMCASLIVIPLGLHYLGKEEYGLWIILQTVGSYLALSEIGLGQTVLTLQGEAYARADYDRVSTILTTSFGLYWLIIAPIWIASMAVVTTQHVSTWLLKSPSAALEQSFALYLALFVSFALLRVPLTVFPASLLGLRETVVRQILELVIWASYIAAMYVTFVLGGKILALTLVTNVVAIVTTASAYLFIRIRHSKVRLSARSFDWKLLKPLLRNSSLFFVIGISLMFQRVGGNLLAGRLGDLSQVPQVYLLLSLFRVVGWSVIDAFSRTIQPYVILFSATGEYERVSFFAGFCTKFSFIIALLFSVGIWLYSEVVLRLWLGHGLFLGYGPLACLAAAFVIDSYGLSASNFMQAVRRHKMIAMVMAAQTILGLLFGLIGGIYWTKNPLFGMCFGLLVASFVTQGVFIPLLLRNWLEIPWSNFVPEILLRPLFAALVAIAIVRMVGPVTELSPGAVLMALTAVAGIAVISWKSILNQQEQVWISTTLRRIISSQPGGTAPVNATGTTA